MPPLPTPSTALLRLATLLVLAATPAACGHYARLHLEATDGSAELSPAIASAAYTYEDENTVHIYLSDIPAADLADAKAKPWTPGTRPVGQIIHIHMFIRPQPGRTPIDPDASNATIRYLVLAPDGATGLYAGGGFLLPKSHADSGTFRATISAGTLVLDAATENFADALGAARLRTSLKVEENDELAGVLARRLNEAARTVR